MMMMMMIDIDDDDDDDDDEFMKTTITCACFFEVTLSPFSFSLVSRISIFLCLLNICFFVFCT